MGVAKYKQYFQGAYYHIYNRGNQQQPIFLEDTDYLGYLKRLAEAKEKCGVTTLCYCLMPNHIHLLVRQDTEMPIHKFISSLHTSYSMYFNRKYQKVGHLFQDRFKQKNITTDAYLLYLSCYIHANPKLDKIVERLEDYPWSSYLDYVGLRRGILCDKEPILKGLSLRQEQSFKFGKEAEGLSLGGYRRYFETMLPILLEKKELKEHLNELGISIPQGQSFVG